MGSGALPAFVRDGFSSAMSESLLLPAAVLLAGLVAVACFERPAHLAPTAEPVEDGVPAGTGR